MLTLDERKRINAVDAMKHKYFEELFDEEDVLLYKGAGIKLFFENYPLSKDLIELGFLNCIAKFNKEV